jgi:hypothetical protein
MNAKKAEKPPAGAQRLQTHDTVLVDEGLPALTTVNATSAMTA